MKIFVALLFTTLAVASQASYLPSAWPYANGLNSWNNWNGHVGYPYASGLSASWPAASVYGGLYGGHKTVVQANLGHNAYPYAGAWSGAGWPATSVYGGLYGGLYGGHKTVVQANLGHEAAYPWGQPWGTYGAGVYGAGWGHHGLAQTVVPVSKQIAATPGSVHVASVPVGGEKVVVV
ncbi:shematrin-like protein 1 [Culex pipiens pallens]|uniref:shematrin-like protein 1 n=1 Tax=Culex pipiens pallens TaxID=42434 RepID=UPI001952EE10|nr:shematrin-like protein 1 [Culex pipiens pallens]